MPFSYSANEDPHGVFSIESGSAQLLVDSNLRRNLAFNVKRDGGKFDKVEVSYEVTYTGPRAVTIPAGSVTVADRGTLVSL